MSKTRLLILDTETSGLDARRHALLSLSAKAWEEGVGVVETLTMYVNMGVFEIDPKAMEVNGIDIQTIRRVGLTPEKACRVLTEFVHRWFINRGDGGDPAKQVPVIVGFNIEFDLKFVRQLFLQADAWVLWEHYFCFRENDVKCIDLKSVVRFLALAQFPFIHPDRLHRLSLNAAARDANVWAACPHTSDGNAETTAQLLDALLHLMRLNVLK